MFFSFFGWRHLLRSGPFYADCHCLCSGTTTAGLAVNFSPRRISVVGIAPPWGISFSRSTQRGSESASASLSFNCKQSLSHSPFHLVIPVGTRVSGKETWFAVCLIMPFAHGNVRIVFANHFGQVDLDGLKGSGPLSVSHFSSFWSAEVANCIFCHMRTCFFPYIKYQTSEGQSNDLYCPLSLAFCLFLCYPNTHTQNHTLREAPVSHPPLHTCLDLFSPVLHLMMMYLRHLAVFTISLAIAKWKGRHGGRLTEREREGKQARKTDRVKERKMERKRKIKSESRGTTIKSRDNGNTQSCMS